MGKVPDLKVFKTIDLRVFIDFSLQKPHIDTIWATSVGQYITLNMQYTQHKFAYNIYGFITQNRGQILSSHWFWQKRGKESRSRYL